MISGVQIQLQKEQYFVIYKGFLAYPIKYEKVAMAAVVYRVANAPNFNK